MNDWTGIQEWVRDYTPQDALFITPPYLSGFRVISKRATVLEVADAEAVLRDPEFADIWMERMNALGYNYSSAKDPILYLPGPSKVGRLTYYHQGSDRYRMKYNDHSKLPLIDICDRYNADYYIKENMPPAPFEKIFSNDTFTLYKIKKI